NASECQHRGCAGRQREGARMRFLASDLLLFSCLAVLITSMGIGVASLLISVLSWLGWGRQGAPSTKAPGGSPRGGVLLLDTRGVTQTWARSAGWLRWIFRLPAPLDDLDRAGELLVPHRHFG